MKEAWCLATSHAEASARQIIIPTPSAGRSNPGFATRRTFASAWGWVSCAFGPPTARQAASPQRLRDRSLDAARRRRRKSRHGPPSQVQHRQASHPFALPPGLQLTNDRLCPNRDCGPSWKGSAKSSCKIARSNKLSRSSKNEGMEGFGIAHADAPNELNVCSQCARCDAACGSDFCFKAMPRVISPR